jgi:hypothetical protein
MYFECDRADLAALFLRQVVANAPECLLKSVSPLVLFGSLGERAGKEFTVILRDEIPLTIEVNASPALFVDFAWTKGVTSEHPPMRPIGCRMLLAIVSTMKNEVRAENIELVGRILEMISGRMWPYKENLIEVLELFVDVLPDITEQFVDVIEKQTARQKSVFRAAAFRCLMKISGKREVHREEIGKQMIDAIMNGTVVAVQAALACLPLLEKADQFRSVIEVTYTRLAAAKSEDFERLCKCILELPPHSVPQSFDLTSFSIAAAPFTQSETVTALLTKLRS